LALAGIGVLALAIARGHTPGVIVAALAAVAAIGVAGYDTVHIGYEASKVTLFGSHVESIGWGVVAGVIGAALAGIGLAMTARRFLRYASIGLFAVGAVGAIAAGVVLQDRTAQQTSGPASSNTGTGASTGNTGTANGGNAGTANSGVAGVPVSQAPGNPCGAVGYTPPGAYSRTEFSAVIVSGITCGQARTVVFALARPDDPQAKTQVDGFTCTGPGLRGPPQRPLVNETS
jgi:hypothetical protein